MMRRARHICLAMLLVTGSLAAAAHAQAPNVAVPTTVAPLESGAGANAQIEALRQALKNPNQFPALSVDRQTASGSKIVTVAFGGATFQALSVPTARLDALAGTLSQKITRESRDEPSALMELRSGFDKQTHSVIKGFALAASSLSTDFGLSPAAGAAQDLKVNETFAMALERARAKGFNLSFEQLQMLPATSRLTYVATRRPALGPVAASYGRTLSALSVVLASPEPANQEALRKSAGETRQAYVDSWPRLRNDPEARRLAVLSLDGLARQSELKAVYGVSSNYSPNSYRGIYFQSTRAVAISAPDGQVVCSGVALTDHWVMTAGHCFAGRAWQSMKVVFPKADGALGEALKIRQQWPDPAPGSRGADAIDYAFVRVDPTATVTAQLSAADAAAAAVGQVHPVCLRPDPAGYEEAVVVIGYAANAKLVYDHAYVWYPFQLYESEFQTVEAMTGARLQRLAEAFFPGSATNQENFIQSNLKSFDEAYATKIGSGSQSRHEYRGRATDVLADRPMFGFDTDTQSGNSGGPVYSRVDVCVVGVFGGGRPDNVKITEATWKEHEFATPLSAVLKDLKAYDAATLVEPADRANVAALLAAIAGLQQ